MAYIFHPHSWDFSWAKPSSSNAFVGAIYSIHSHKQPQKWCLCESQLWKTQFCLAFGCPSPWQKAEMRVRKNYIYIGHRQAFLVYNSFHKLICMYYNILYVMYTFIYTLSRILCVMVKKDVILNLIIILFRHTILFLSAYDTVLSVSQKIYSLFLFFIVQQHVNSLLREEHFKHQYIQTPSFK